MTEAFQYMKNLKKKKIKFTRSLQPKPYTESDPDVSVPPVSSPSMESKKSYLGQLAILRGLISHEVLEKALEQQNLDHEMYPLLGEILVRGEFLKKEDLIALLKEQDKIRQALRYYPSELSENENAILRGNILSGKRIPDKAIQNAKIIRKKLLKIDIDRTVFQILYDKGYIKREQIAAFIDLAKEQAEEKITLIRKNSQSSNDNHRGDDDTTTEIIIKRTHGSETTILQAEDILRKEIPEEGITTKEDLYACLMSVTQEVPTPYPDNFFAGLLIRSERISLKDMSTVRAYQGELKKFGINISIPEFMIACGYMSEKEVEDIENLLIAVGSIVPQHGPTFKENLDEEWLLKILLSIGMLTIEEIEEIEKSQKILEDMSMPFSMIEIIVRKGLVGKRQIDLLISLRKEGKLLRFLP